MKAKPRTAIAATPDPDDVLTRATLKAGNRLGLSQKELAAVVGVSPATVSRLAHGSTLGADTKEGELAVQFLRVFRSLDALLGGDAEKCRQWLRAENAHLAGVPAALLQTVPGLVHVAEYLDAMRGHG